ncbi:hypothetical protein [Saccharibacillus endophyticus]|uniref:DNA topology modulation protein FlaR n=1 Tax=Saccharibacillus endophyticus TaxID=2060666 RepID=A0ABQ1ZL62_9BACL|nr:hypothetical protein [Saccharibacillus endophyticus]GGH68448.1 hypothetical protein GCM10007362_02470 [Saccharibacillus endophyticus]
MRASRDKILIIGIVASGKTTLARQLSVKHGIPWHELDNIVHRRMEEGSRKRTREEQMELIRQIDREGPWIMEGVDRSSYAALYEMADIVIFLDPPLWKRKLRIVRRFAKQKLGLEPAHYKPDRTILKAMFRWTADFERNRPQFETKLAGYSHKVVTLRTRREIDRYQNGGV